MYANQIGLSNTDPDWVKEPVRSYFQVDASSVQICAISPEAPMVNFELAKSF